MKRLIMFLAAGALVALPGSAAAKHHSRHSHHGAKRAHHVHHAAVRAHTVRIGHDPQLSTVAGSTSGSTTTTSGEPQSAGTVASFTGGKLTLTLADGSSVTGLVTDATRIRCETPGGESEMPHNDGDRADGGQSSGDHGSSGNGDDNQTTTTDTTTTSDSNTTTSEPGDDNGQDEAGQGDQQAPQSCTVSPGETVGSADLQLSSNGSVWREVELIPTSTTTTTTTTTTSGN